MFSRTTLSEFIVTYIELDKHEPTYSSWSAFKFYFRLKRLFRKASPDTRTEFIFRFLEKEVRTVIDSEEGPKRSIMIGICKDKISILIKVIEGLKYINHTNQLHLYCKVLQEALDRDTYTFETTFRRRMNNLREEMDAIVSKPLGEMVFQIQKRKLPIIYKSFMEIWETYDVRFEELRVMTHLIFESQYITKKALNKGLNEFITPMINSKIGMDEALDGMLNKLFPWEDRENEVPIVNITKEA